PISLSITNTQLSSVSSSYPVVRNLFDSLEKIKLNIENLEITYPRQLKDAQSGIETAQNTLQKKEEAVSDAKKNLEKQSPTKKKLFKWAVETGMAYKAAKKKDKVSLKLLAEYKLAKKLVLLRYLFFQKAKNF
ncbi:MAG: hypothetical protein QW279_04465, partial [Candidatus Jordarchaeaceae archaeon]